MTYRFVAVLSALLISGCGGGEGDPVTGITATNLKYGAIATLTIRGNALDNAIQVASPACSQIFLGAVTSAKERSASCIVGKTGDWPITVSSSGNYVVYTSTLSVPAPVTAIDASNLKFAQQATLTLSGEPQNAAIRVKSDKCIDITLDAVSTSATRSAKCTLVGAGPVSFSITNASGTTTLYQKTFNATDPTSLQTYNQKYSQKTTIVYPTQGQNSNLTLVATGCDNLTLDDGSYAAVRTATCTASHLGTVRFDVKDNSTNTVTQTASITIPSPQITLKTSLGDIVMELNPTAAPLSVNNLLSYVSKGFYSNTLFHRVIPGFMVQGGGFTTGMVQKTDTAAAIKLESQNGLLNTRGSVAMARTTAADSATSQFFVNLVDNAFLNYASADSPGYAVFGKVVTGMDVVDNIAKVTTATVGTNANVPVTDVLILSATQNQ